MSALLALLLAAQSPTIVAHRGLGGGAPENTLAAFRQSVARGVAIIEMDVRTTRDGELVILHDTRLDRTTDCTGRIADITLARIKRCDAGAGERVPTLGEALDFVRTSPARLLLDIKPDASLDQVIREVRHHRAERNVILGLRRAADVAHARRELPETSTLGFLPNATDTPAFVQAGAHAIRLWSDWIEADPSHISRAHSLGAEAWIMIGRKLPRRKRDWRALHARVLAADPDALITDRPELVP